MADLTEFWTIMASIPEEVFSSLTGQPITNCRGQIPGMTTSLWLSWAADCFHSATLRADGNCMSAVCDSFMSRLPDNARTIRKVVKEVERSTSGTIPALSTSDFIDTSHLYLLSDVLEKIHRDAAAEEAGSGSSVWTYVVGSAAVVTLSIAGYWFHNARGRLPWPFSTPFSLPSSSAAASSLAQEETTPEAAPLASTYVREAYLDKHETGRPRRVEYLVQYRGIRTEERPEPSWEGAVELKGNSDHQSLLRLYRARNPHLNMLVCGGA